MKLDKDSFDVIIGMTLLMVALISVVLFFIHNRYISWSLAGLFFVFLLFVIWFHRVPSRAPQGDEKSVLAVADGRVVIVEKAFEKEFLKKVYPDIHLHEFLRCACQLLARIRCGFLL